MLFLRKISRSDVSISMTAVSLALVHSKWSGFMDRCMATYVTRELVGQDDRIQGCKMPNTGRISTVGIQGRKTIIVSRPFINSYCDFSSRPWETSRWLPCIEVDQYEEAWEQALCPTRSKASQSREKTQSHLLVA